MERRALQIAVMLAACVPVAGGLAGAVMGAEAFGAWPGRGADSHVRYLSGLLLAIGLFYWSAVPAIERRTGMIRLLTAIVVTGGLSRLAGVFLAGDPGKMRWTLIMELLVAPALCLWQGRVAGNPHFPTMGTESPRNRQGRHMPPRPPTRRRPTSPAGASRQPSYEGEGD